MKKVKEVMSASLACCTSSFTLQDAAKLMVEHDCGGLPIVNNLTERKPVGFITDRDICCRTVAKGLNPLEMKANECMTSPAFTVSQDASIDEVINLMSEKQIRRLPVVDEKGSCCGMIAQADLVKHLDNSTSGHVLKSVSRESAAPSNIH
jgi:CBS domain-containing protein